MSRNYKFRNKSGLYFVSFATVYWIDVFTREQYLTILADSIDYCRKQKGLKCQQPIRNLIQMGCYSKKTIYFLGVWLVPKVCFLVTWQ